MDNFITGRRENVRPLLASANFHFSRLDITSRHFLAAFLKVPLGEIYHLACPTGVPNIARLGEEMMLASSVGTRHVLELARMHRARFLFSSSSEVYGQAEVSPQHERYCGNVDPLGPRSPYEEGKRFAESLVALYVRTYGVDADIVRLFNAYGPGMSPEDTRVLPRFLQSIRNGRPLTVYGDGRQTRTFCYIDDFIRGLRLVMERGERGEVYNIGGSRPLAIKELARLVIRITGYRQGISLRPHFVEDHSGRKPSLVKIRKLGWRPAVPLREGLRRMIASWGIRAAV